MGTLLDVAKKPAVVEPRRKQVLANALVALCEVLEDDELSEEERSVLERKIRGLWSRVGNNTSQTGLFIVYPDKRLPQPHDEGVLLP